MKCKDVLAVGMVVFVVAICGAILRTYLATDWLFFRMAHGEFEVLTSRGEAHISFCSEGYPLDIAPFSAECDAGGSGRPSDGGNLPMDGPRAVWCTSFMDLGVSKERCCPPYGSDMNKFAGYIYWLRLPLFPTLPIPLIYAAMWGCGLNARFRASRGQCAKCGYDLRGTSEFCPECGVPVPSGHQPNPCMLRSGRQLGIPLLKSPASGLAWRVAIVICLGKLVCAIALKYLLPNATVPPNWPTLLTFLLSFPLNGSFLEGPERDPLGIARFGAAVLLNSLFLGWFATFLLLKKSNGKKSNGTALS